MGFTDWGLSKEEAERRQREHEAELERIQREGDEAVADIYRQMRQSAKDHSDYRNWLWNTGRTDVSFEDWKAGRYVHVVISRY